MGYFLKSVVVVLFAVLVYVVFFMLQPHSFTPARLRPARHIPNFNYELVRVNGIQISLIDEGPKDGELLVFLHGFPESALITWSEQITFFSEKGYRVIAPDLRGYNKSSKPSGVENYDPALIAQDVVEIIRKYAKKSDGETVLIGHDWGAALSWNIALRHPKLLKTMIIVNAPHFKPFAEAMIGRQLLRSWYAFYFCVPFFSEWRLQKDNFSSLATALVSSSNDQSFSQVELDLLKEMWKDSVHYMLLYYRFSFPRLFLGAIFGIPEELTPTINTPTYIFWGKKDHAIGSDTAEASCRMPLTSNCTLKFIEDSTHWVSHEQSHLSEHILSAL